MSEIIASKPFDHFIITLFNLKNFLDGSNQESIWLQWTEDRIKLFQEFCLPSVVNQTNKDFTWLLYFDISSPLAIKEYVHDITRNYPFIQIIYANSYEGFLKQYIDDLKLKTTSNWVLQTRFDNDDILHQCAIDTIQAKAKLKHQTFINLSSGYTFEQSSGYLSHYFYSMGPFLTIVEDTNKVMQGIYKVNHWQWPGLKLSIGLEFLKRIKIIKTDVVFYLDKPLWIQYIHQNNMHNSSNRGYPVFKQRNLNAFHPSLKMNRSPLNRIFSHIHYVWWKRYFKATIVKIFS